MTSHFGEVMYNRAKITHKFGRFAWKFSSAGVGDCGRCGNHQTVNWFHAYWCFTSERTFREDDENYLIAGLRKLLLQLKQRQQMILILYSGYHHN